MIRESGSQDQQCECCVRAAKDLAQVEAELARVRRLLSAPDLPAAPRTRSRRLQGLLRAIDIFSRTAPGQIVGTGAAVAVAVGAPLWAVLEDNDGIANDVLLGAGGGLVATVYVALGLAIPLRRFERDPGRNVLYMSVALASSVIGAVLWFAALAFRLSAGDPEAFNRRLSRLDAVYLAAVTFSTTGFGDLHPVSDAAKAAVLAQLGVGLVLLSVVLVATLPSILELARRRPR